MRRRTSHVITLEEKTKRYRRRSGSLLVLICYSLALNKTFNLWNGDHSSSYSLSTALFSGTHISLSILCLLSDTHQQRTVPHVKVSSSSTTSSASLLTLLPKGPEDDNEPVIDLHDKSSNLDAQILCPTPAIHPPFNINQSGEYLLMYFFFAFKYLPSNRKTMSPSLSPPLGTISQSKVPSSTPSFSWVSHGYPSD